MIKTTTNPANQPNDGNPSDISACSDGYGFTAYYTEQDAERKTHLIEKKGLFNGLTSSDWEELEDLKKRSAKRRDELARLPIREVRKMHSELSKDNAQIESTHEPTKDSD